MTDGSARITAGELVVVLSHYDVGVIDEVRRFRGGSRQSPKVLVATRGGDFLLKRRGLGPDGSVGRVARAHALHAALWAAAFPVAELIRSRAGETAVRLSGPGPASGVYELYRFVNGERYRRQEEQAREAGRLLAELHHIAARAGVDAGEGAGGFHARGEMREALAEAARRLDGRADEACAELAALYWRAAGEAERLGASDGPVGTLHGDWHPGNMLFAGEPGAKDGGRGRVAAVLDLDSVRSGPLVMDVANGALQFAVHRRIREADDSQYGMEAEAVAAQEAGAEPDWRITLGPELLSAFCAGYRGAAGGLGGAGLSAAAWQATPWLMVQALIVEAVVPIAQAGAFGKVDPVGLLQIVRRAAGSIADRAGRVAALAGAP